MFLLLYNEYSATKLVLLRLAQYHLGWLNYLPFSTGWLGYDKASKKLVVTTTANQDPLFATTGLVPILGIDVWEHAYYLVVRHFTFTLPCGLTFSIYFWLYRLFFCIFCSTKMFDLTTSRWFGRSLTGRIVLKGLLRRRSKDKFGFGNLIFCIFPLNEFSSLATGLSYLFLDVFHFSSVIFF